MTTQDNTVLVSLLSGMFAGSFSRLFVHPIDTIKSKVQVSSKFTFLASLRSTLRKEGIKGLYLGAPTVIIGSIPGCVLYFGTYEFSKKHLLSFEVFRKSEFLTYFACGMLAEIVACIVFVPIDVVKERLQVQSNLKTYKYSNDLNAFRTIIKTEGFRGIYKAYGATVMSFGPFSAINFSFFEFFKGFFVKNDAQSYLNRVADNSIAKKEKADLSFSQSLLCSSLSNLIAGFITNPLDLVKLRMQVQRANQGSDKETKYKNMVQGLVVVAKEEGMRGLFRGSMARCGFLVPYGALVFSTLEAVRPIIRDAL